MSELAPKRRAFVNEMLQGREAAEYGFEVLAKRQDAHEFLGALVEANLLSARNNPEPVAAKQEGYFQIPYWRALDYLQTVATHASATNDLTLAGKIERVLLAISRGEHDPRGPQDNYHTHRKLVEIISSLPDGALSVELLGEIKSWIGGRFERGMVVAEIGRRLLPRLLKSVVPGHGQLALMLFDFATQIEWKEEEGAPDNADVVWLADEYWVAKLLDKNGESAARRLGRDFIALLRLKVKELFSRGTRSKASLLERPAIEDHTQNHAWNRAANAVVEALRDGLLVALNEDANDAIVNSLIDMYLHGAEIERRIAIYIFNVRFDQLGATFLPHVDSRLFSDECVHETYHFLQEHYVGMDAGIKESIYRQLADMTTGALPRDVMVRRMRTQRRWLGAIAGKGSPDADALFAQLVANPDVGPQPQHPDFLSYMTNLSGPGPSPYTVGELLHFLGEGSLVKQLNEFEPSRRWNGPTKRALVDTLEEAIKQRPKDFLAAIDTLFELQRPYQYGFLNAFSELWGANTADLEWDPVWRLLLNAMERLFDERFWYETVVDDGDLTPSRDWIPPLIADLIKAGTRDDAHSFNAALLPHAYRLISMLLSNLPRSTEAPGKDPMHEAINSSRGRVLEALFILALRWSRVSDKDGDHCAAWEQVVDLFSTELQHAEGKNFEFTTLAANYCAHIHYLSPDWFSRNQKALLCPANELSFRCVVGGLIYAPDNKMLYEVLISLGTVERALNLPDLPEQGREKMLERVALAYLWGQETFTTRRIESLFTHGKEEDLITVLSFFWSVSNQELSEEQVAAVLAFWRRAVAFGLSGHPKSEMLLGSAARLACFLKSLDQSDADLLKAIAPFANADHSSDFLVKELGRLAKDYPKEIADASIAYLRKNGPEYDFEHLWLDIATQIAAAGLKFEAIEIVDIMHSQPGFDELYRTIQ